MPRRYWLMKSEADVYSIHDLAREGTTSWEGVRNCEARNIMRDQMGVGDEVLFYHSSARPSGAVGVARVVKRGYPDPSAFDRESPYHDPGSDRASPRWVMVDIAFVEAFARVVSLEEIRAHPSLGQMALVRRSRLSVQPVSKREFDVIRAMGRRR
jgi:predicted RNA-binding protein with PUA-like domain